MQFGRIGNFGLLEMTRQRLRESSVKWNMVLSVDSFANKIIKKTEELAFSNKAKIVDISIPNKVKKFIEENLAKEISYFTKKYKINLNFISESNFLIPEYKIDLLNKNKKTIFKVENIIKNENIIPKKNHIRKDFKKNKFKKYNKFKKKYKFDPKVKKNYSETKKIANY